MKLTKPQLAALNKYADGRAHYTAHVDINPKVFHNIVDMELITRDHANPGGYYSITEKGCSALEANAMTVYGGIYDGRRRMIVAAPTKKAAHAAMQIVTPSIGTLKTWHNWTAETGNAEECAIARAEPLTVFINSDPMRSDSKFEKAVKP